MGLPSAVPHLITGTLCPGLARVWTSANQPQPPLWSLHGLRALLVRDSAELDLNCIVRHSAEVKVFLELALDA